MHKKIEHVLRSIEQNYIGTDNPYWNVSREVGIFLNSLVRISSATRVLEIGTSIGYSALFLAEPFCGRGGEVVTVESHEERFEIAQSHFSEAGITDSITQIKGHAPEVLGDIDGEFDMVFFDATKMEHVSYIQAIEESLSDRAIVIADNIISHAEEMKEYIAYMENSKLFHNTTIPLGTGLLMSVKESNSELIKLLFDYV